ncbi:MAG: hypothetical protein ING59_00920 [Burkholderiales bacterium]|jgi:hypothetical protein|nr:hypothetical protein [Burkholderiales bacterium]
MRRPNDCTPTSDFIASVQVNVSAPRGHAPALPFHVAPPQRRRPVRVQATYASPDDRPAGKPFAALATPHGAAPFDQPLDLHFTEHHMHAMSTIIQLYRQQLDTMQTMASASLSGFERARQSALEI